MNIFDDLSIIFELKLNLSHKMSVQLVWLFFHLPPRPPSVGVEGMWGEGVYRAPD